MMKEESSSSYLFGGNAPYVEEMYEAYLDNPGSVPDKWRDYFDALQNVPAADGSSGPDVAHAPIVESFAQRARANTLFCSWLRADCAFSSRMPSLVTRRPGNASRRSFTMAGNEDARMSKRR